MPSLESKIVVLGTQGVGKTSVVVRYVGDSFSKHVSPTIGASFFTCKLSIDDYKVKLQVWDTAGQERFRSMTPMYYRKANAAMIVYDITSADSFADMKRWVLELMKNVDEKLVMVVLGNKCDLRNERKVSLNHAQEYAASIGALHYETSALTNEGIGDAFVHISRSLIHIHEKDFVDHDSPLNKYDNGVFADRNSNVKVHDDSCNLNDNTKSSGCCY